MVINETARLEILLPTESEWRNIGENDIINNSLSVSSKCMDDSSFSLGGAYSAQLSVKIRLQNTNTYKVTGAKIKVFSQYSGQSEILRGIFWVTSVSRKNDIYTISASDSLVWLDSTSYDDSRKGTGKNFIYDEMQGSLKEYLRDLGGCFGVILGVINKYNGNENQLAFYDDEGIINYCPSDVGYCLLPPDMVGEISTKNPRDYASWLAEIACGFVFVDCSDGNAKIRIGQFGEEVNHKISYDEVELDSCEIADFTLDFQQVYTDVYDGSSGSAGNNGNGITIDISDNPFKDGHWQYNRVIGSDGEEYGNAMDIIDNIYEKLRGLEFRPFNLKCHCTKNFQLGQKITLPNSQKITLPNSQESIITSIKWQFRGGYTLSCAGKDTRVLCASARRSQSAKVKDLAYTKINTEIAKLNSDINKKFQNVSDESYKDWETIQSQFADLQNQIDEINEKLNGGS